MILCPIIIIGLIEHYGLLQLETREVGGIVIDFFRESYLFGRD